MTRTTRATPAGVPRSRAKRTRRERKRYWEPWRRAVSFAWAKDKMKFTAGVGWSIDFDAKAFGGTHEQAS